MFIYIIKIFSVIIFLLSLIFLSLKIDKFYNIRKIKHTQVLDIIRLNKNNSIVTLKIGEEGVLLGVSPSNINKIKDIKREDILKIEKELEKNKIYFDKKISFAKKKIKDKKEGL